MDGYDYFIALVSATSTEEESIKRLYDDWQLLRVAGDGQQYYETSFERDGRNFKIVTARQDEMGMTAAGVLAMKMAALFKPKYLIMVGIAAGVARKKSTEQIYGDVVVANVVWDYSSGKFVSSNSADVVFGEVGFIPRPRFINADEDLIELVERVSNSPDNEFHVHIGPMACGSTVVANREVVDKQIYSQQGSTAALDMESYAVMYAVKHAPMPRPKCLVIKSVCDYADEEKSDQYQKFAAYTSSQFAKWLIEKHLP